MATDTVLHSLISLADFKAILGFDDREDALSRYCLVMASYSIEQYCRRRLFYKKVTDCLSYTGDTVFILREYPVREVLGVWGMGSGEIIEPDLYRLLPDCGIEEDMPFYLTISPALPRLRGFEGIKVLYYAGYSSGEAPADLASACLELAAWNMSRYRGRRIGITGNVRGSGKDGEHLEAAMPENVRLLLEPYQRRVI